jgi:predicted anti-sigma-YlaC factor YlaD
MTMRERVIRVSILVAFLVSAVLVAGGCSIKRYAVNTIGDVLASGDSVYESDDDIALIGEALPFSLKLVESLLAESPRHRGLLVTAARGFVLYAYAYVQYDADVQALVDLDRARALRGRARRLYERAFGYALRALEQSYPGFSKALSLRPTAAAAMVGTGTNDQDVVLLYWTAASLGLAISVSKTEPAMLARLPEVEALLARALELDEAWNAGALHEFQITWAAAQRTRGDQEELRRHYERALALSRGQRASLYVAYAEAVAVPNQDRTEFVSLMEKALAVDPNADPAHRLLNLIAQRRAWWLLQRIDELFL